MPINQLLAESTRRRWDSPPRSSGGKYGIRLGRALIRASIPKHVQLRLDLQANLPVIEADTSQLQQIIMNLIINGAEAMGEENGTVYVSTGIQQVDVHYLRTVTSGHEITPGKYVSLRVQDTGCGMDEDTRAKIFDPFFTTKFMGRGLGFGRRAGYRSRSQRRDQSLQYAWERNGL